MNEGFSAQEAEDLINNIYSGNLSTKYYDAGPAIANVLGFPTLHLLQVIPQHGTHSLIIGEC